MFNIYEYHFAFTTPSKPQLINLHTSQRKVTIICFTGGKKLKLAVKSLAQGYRGGGCYAPGSEPGSLNNASVFLPQCSTVDPVDLCVDFMGPQKISVHGTIFWGMILKREQKGCEGTSKNMIYQEVLLLQHVGKW